MKDNQRVEYLLALLLIRSYKGEPMVEAASALSLAGFTNIEIADLLQTSPNTVNQRLFEKRRKAKPKKA